jgi:hypothetical protein
MNAQDARTLAAYRSLYIPQVTRRGEQFFDMPNDDYDSSVCAHIRLAEARRMGDTHLISSLERRIASLLLRGL